MPMGNPTIPRFDPERLARQIKEDRQSEKMPWRRKGGILVPALKPIPSDATSEQRQQMYEEYCQELARLNPRFHGRDGKPKMPAAFYVVSALLIGFVLYVLIEIF